jgi:Flp pilus assembly pilin Flp
MPSGIEPGSRRAPAPPVRERGQAFVEYVLLLVFLALALALAYTLYAGDIASGFTAVERRLLGF